MKYEVEIKEEQNVHGASLFFGHFSKDVTFQLSKDLMRGGGKLPLFSPFYICLGKWAIYTFSSIFIVMSTSTFLCVDSYGD